jgi:hypothetical protein
MSIQHKLGVLKRLSKMAKEETRVRTQDPSRGLQAELDDYLSRLDRVNLNDIPDFVERLGGWYASVDEQRERLGLDPKVSNVETNELLRKLVDWLKEGAQRTRKDEWEFRIGAEAQELDRQGWYPFFLTLTVDPAWAAARGLTTQDVIQSGDEWRRFRQRLAEVVRKTLGLAQVQKGGPPVSEYFRYACVTEHGKRNHHHLHAIVWCRDVPPRWKVDPNIRRRIKNARECLPLKALWPCAKVTTMMYWRCQNDLWTRKHGFIVPEGTKKLRSPFKSGTYLCKYLGKESKQWFHRMKATRGLGFRILDKMFLEMPLQQLMNLLQPTPMNMRQQWSNITEVPLPLMRKRASYWAFSKAWRLGSESRFQIWDHVTDDSRQLFSEMQRSVLDGQRPWRMPTWQVFGWLQSLLPHEPCESSRLAYQDALKSLKRHYPADKSKAATTMRGNAYASP